MAPEFDWLRRPHETVTVSEPDVKGNATRSGPVRGTGELRRPIPTGSGVADETDELTFRREDDGRLAITEQRIVS